MGYILRIFTWIVIGFMVSMCNQYTNEKNKHQGSIVDTSHYTDVILVNNSNLDSVEVYITLQNMESIVGKFGMDSSNIQTYCAPDSIPCVGKFWAKKGVKYHLGDTSALKGAIVTWGVQNQACPAAQKIVDKNGKKLYPYGINNFEFTVNTWWRNGIVTGEIESFDITCVDGVHSRLRQTVSSFGNRYPNSPNFGAFWDFGYYNKPGQLQPFITSFNGITLDSCIDIPGVFPYGCDWGYRKYNPPTPCDSPKYNVSCSTKFGNINTSQTNRQGQGGTVTCEFLGFSE